MKNKDIQAMARIWRDGQKRKVYIYRLLTSGTIEESIYQRQITKVSLSDNLIDEKNSTNKFSIDELKDLFTFHDSKCYTHDLLNCQCENGSDNMLYQDFHSSKDEDNDSLDGFIVHDDENNNTETNKKDDNNNDNNDNDNDNDNSSNKDDVNEFSNDLNDLIDNDESNTDYLEVGSFNTDKSFGSFIFNTKLATKKNKKKSHDKEIPKNNKKDDHHMDELKNEWSHYLIDPLQLKPYEKKIANYTLETEKENNDTKEDINQHPKSNLVKEILQDPNINLSIKSLNDKVLKNIIIEEEIDCLENKKDNSIEFIFTREFKN